MNEIFAKHHTARMLVYTTLFALAISAIYLTFFTSKVYHLAQSNKESIESLQNRMSQREHVAATYIPMLLTMKSLVDMHQSLLNRIMDRQTTINRLLEKPLKKEPRRHQ